jgi:hypothetical protein
VAITLMARAISGNHMDGEGNQWQSVAITFSERTETQSLMATLSASECHTPSALITPRRPHCPLRSPAICTITTGTRKVGMHSRCSRALRPSAQFESAWHWRNESKKAPYLPLEETPSACNQHAISMQSACNQYAISMQSVCNQYAISMQSAYGKWEKSHSGARRSLAGGADALCGTLSVACETETQISRFTQHALGMQSACNQRAISMQSECNQQMHSACTRHANSEPARPRPRAPACIGAREARTADRGAAASSCAWRGGRRR